MVSCHCDSDVVTLCHGVTRCVSRVTCSLSECQTPTDTLCPVLDSLVPLSALRPRLSPRSVKRKCFPRCFAQPLSDTAGAKTCRAGALKLGWESGTHSYSPVKTHTLANCIEWPQDRLRRLCQCRRTLVCASHS